MTLSSELDGTQATGREEAVNQKGCIEDGEESFSRHFRNFFTFPEILLRI